MVVTLASPSCSFCRVSIALNSPMVSCSSPPMEPLRSRMKTNSVRFFFIINALRFVVYRFRWQKDTTNRRAKGQRAGDKSRTQLFLIVFKQQRIDLIDVIDFVFQAIPHDPVPLGAIRKGIACALEQVDGFIFGQVQPHRKGQHRFLFGVVVAIALNFGEMLPGDVGLLVHGGVFQSPARQ